MSPRSRNALGLTLLFGVLVGFYAATFSFRAITDTRLNSLQTRALVEDGTVDLARYPKTQDFVRPDLTARQIVPRNGGVYSVYGIGISIVAAPVYAPLVRLDVSESFLQGSVAVLFVAGSVTLMYRILTGIAPSAIAAGATAVFAFGTTMWTVASTALFQQGPVVFFECVGLTGLFSRRSWGPVIAGFGFASAAFIRPTAGIPLLAVGAFYLVDDRRNLLLFAAGSALPLAALLIQNRVIWGEWLAGGYSQHGVGFNAPWPSTLFRILFGWWRGLFVYSPALLLAAPGFFYAIRHVKGYAERRMVALGIAALAAILITSRWSAWHGGLNQFGYRLLLEVVPFLIVLGGYAVVRAERLRPIAVFLGVLSILTMTWGAAPSPTGWDGKLFASDFSDTSLGQAWTVFFDEPLDGLLRLAGVAAICWLMFTLARRLFPERPPLVDAA